MVDVVGCFVTETYLSQCNTFGNPKGSQFESRQCRLSAFVFWQGRFVHTPVNTGVRTVKSHLSGCCTCGPECLPFFISYKHSIIMYPHMYKHDFVPVIPHGPTFKRSSSSRVHTEPNESFFFFLRPNISADDPVVLNLCFDEFLLPVVSFPEPPSIRINPIYVGEEVTYFASALWARVETSLMPNKVVPPACFLCVYATEPLFLADALWTP